MRRSVPLDFNASSLGIGALPFTLSTLPLAFGAFVFRFGAAVFLVEALLHCYEFSRKFGDSRECGGGTAAFDVDLFGSSIGSFTLGVGSLAFSVRVLPRLKSPLSLEFRKPMFFFRSAMLLFGALTLDFNFLYQSDDLATVFFSAFARVFGSRDFFASLCSFSFETLF
jgi:hypothetical protein